MPTANVTVTDVTGHYTGSISQIAQNVIAAFNEWKAFIAPSSAVVDILLRLVDPLTDVNVARANGGSSTVSAGTNGLLTIAEPAGAQELRTGIDPNGSVVDITISLNVDFSAIWYWLDPLDGSVPTANRTSLVSVFAHEIGHGLGITGYRDWSTYNLPGNFETPMDALIVVIDGQPFFTGANTAALYGGNLPLTAGNLYHFGNLNGLGGQLGGDLMNGWVFPFGIIPVTALDARVLSDLGIPTIFSDRLQGTSQNDTINGGAGNDTVMGGLGADSVEGGPGFNYLRGDDGADTIVGGADFDDINGNMGNDTASGGLGNDWVVGGKDNDRLAGDDGADIVYGNLGDDTCDGGVGDDLVRGGQGNDTLAGGAGADWISGDRDNDTMSGGAGADTFHSFGEAGIDRVLDFNRAEGDRVQIDVGSTWTLAQVGADTVITFGGDGGQMILVGVSLASLSGDWIFTL